jgi:hypothetical protein
MKFTLGWLEQAILLACLAHQRPDKKDNAPDLYRDELPALLWDWNGRRLYRGWAFARDAKRQPQTYPDVPAGEYRTKQAALTRALQTLYQKDLINAGGNYEATGLTIYSPRRAAALGIEPAQPLSETEMSKRYYPKVEGASSWSYRSIGAKPRMHRNIKSIRLTELGERVARQLQVKSQNRSCDLTRISLEVDQPRPPLPPSEAEQEAQRQELAAAEAVIEGASGSTNHS